MNEIYCLKNMKKRKIKLRPIAKAKRGDNFVFLFYFYINYSISYYRNRNTYK